MQLNHLYYEFIVLNKHRHN